MLSETVRRAARQYGDRAAFVTADGWSCSYEQLDRSADLVAAGLMSMRLGRGSVVGLVLESSVDYVAVYLGAARIGAVTAGINTRLAAPEVARCLTTLRPDLVVTTQALAHLATCDAVKQEQLTILDEQDPPAHFPVSWDRKNNQENHPPSPLQRSKSIDTDATNDIDTTNSSTDVIAESQGYNPPQDISRSLQREPTAIGGSLRNKGQAVGRSLQRNPQAIGGSLQRKGQAVLRDDFLSAPKADNNRPVCICFTSGTSGTPKGAWFTARQLRAIASMDSGAVWGDNSNKNTDYSNPDNNLNPNNDYSNPVSHLNNPNPDNNLNNPNPNPDNNPNPNNDYSNPVSSLNLLNSNSNPSNPRTGRSRGSNDYRSDRPNDDRGHGPNDDRDGGSDDSWGGGHTILSTHCAHVGFMTKLPWMLASGQTTHLLPRWSASKVLKLIARYQMTAVTGVAPQIALLVRHPLATELDFSAVKAIVVGGAASSPELVRAARRCFGAPYSIRYSSTESGGVGLATSLTADDEEACHTVGRPRPGVEAEIRDKDGTVLDGGQVGELWLKSSAVMSGYWNNAAATEDVLDNQGWLRTGDLASVDERGLFRLAGRSDEMFIRGGYNVYPMEVEAVLADHPEVVEVAVVGQPDPVMGEFGLAVVVPRNPAVPPTLEDLRRFAADSLAHYKLPEALKLIDALPRNASGKINRRSFNST